MFDVGDVVKLVGPNTYVRANLTWLSGMEEYLGKVGIITYADEEDVKIDGFGDYYLSKVWLEPAAEDNFESEDLQSLFE